MRTNSMPSGVLFVFVSLILVSCSHSTRSLFFDIPPAEPKPEETLESLPGQTVQKDNRSLTTAYAMNSEDTERPAIESLQTWEEVLALLPKDYKKTADWSAAIRQGVIKPRGNSVSTQQNPANFGYDFVVADEKPKNEWFFPHSAHTEWLSCQNCHTSIYPYKRNPASMKEMRQGESCGACHGKVAFSLRQCKRCHLQR